MQINRGSGNIIHGFINYCTFNIVVDFARGAAIAGRVFYGERRDQLIVIDLLIECIVPQTTGRWTRRRGSRRKHAKITVDGSTQKLSFINFLNYGK
jgi:hypothetical protein